MAAGMPMHGLDSHVAVYWDHPSPLLSPAQVLAAAYQALAPRGLAGDTRAERALVALLTIPITKYDVVTGLGLSEWGGEGCKCP
jgi:hypothetical protein